MTDKQPSFPIFFLIFMLICTGIFVSLGMWQIKRLEWKTRLLDDYAHAQAVPVEVLKQNTFENIAQLSKREASRLAINGKFVLEKPIFLRGQILEGKPTKALVVRFCMKDKNCIPTILGLTNNEKINLSYTSEITNVIGWIKPPPHNIFTPRNDPARNIWFRLENLDLKSHWPDSLLTEEIFYLEAPPAHLSLAPMPVVNNIRNNHAQYALFWFTASFVTLVITVLRLRRRT